MFTGLKPYPEYENRGPSRLSRVPSPWSVRRLKRVVRNIVEQSDTRRSGDKYIALEHVESWTGRVRIDDSATFEGLIKNFSTGDVLFGKLRPYLAKVVRVDFDGVCSGEFFVLRPVDDAVASDFLELVMRSAQVINEISSSTFGARMPRADWAFVGGVLLALPSQAEQEAIVKFLGHANARIGRAIEAKRKMIALLDEQKRVSLNLIVTHGTGPPTDIRDNGFLCLDAVPLHWETPRLARCLTRVEQGWSPAAAEGALRDDQWAVLTLSAVQRGQFNRYALKPIPVGESVPTQMETSDGDLLLTRSNTRDRVGDVAVVRGVRPKTIISDLIYRLIVDPKMLKTEFLCLVLLSELGRSQIMRDARGSSGTMPKIAQSHIGSWRIVMPPLSEQDRICAEVDEDSRRADVARLRLEQETELLSEFGTRLTSDVVTGQLDVRKAAAELPDLDPADLAGEDIEDIDAVAEEFLDGDEP